ncbi:hypothetical protein FB381_4163 [Nocardioides albertanoniae]|uniref:DUF1684 domain-containing protein n=1 Tax=Nocardioides albertanoniae TaxID=1175486 RepID=A0A543ACA8_9ACTN|nr:DUF1684 domain-containing protein [Nocardioides albertanoniae]TQL70234.1 hypothetical protein FB381_4163 [Nocardioides albertanoniae]
MTFEQAWQRWRDEREAVLRSPEGFLAITGLHWLGVNPQRFAEVPGVWSTGPDGVVVELGEGESLEVCGTTLGGRFVFGAVDPYGVIASFEGGTVEVADRFGTPVLRPRHSDGPFLRNYTGTPTYAPDPAWQLSATFRAYESRRPISVGTVIEGRSSVIDAVGEIEFEAVGRPQRLIAFDGGDDELWLLFTDETSGVTTYAACRQLAVEAPIGDNAVLDFNRAANMPCAYTIHATCPLPPAANHIDVLVEAGEQAPPRPPPD